MLKATGTVGKRRALLEEKKRWHKGWPYVVLLLPALVYVLVFCYQPMYGLLIAFKTYRVKLGILGSPWTGLDHFIRFFSYPDFWRLVKNTLTISLYQLATFPIPILLALMLNELRKQKLKNVAQMITYAPHFISTVVVCSMLTLFLDSDVGIINRIIELLGGTKSDLLSQPQHFAAIFVWSDVWQNTGWNMVIYLAALAGVPTDCIEAAEIDGANRLQIIRHVNIPHIMPTVIIMLILNMGKVMNIGYEKIMLLQNPLNLDVSQIIPTYIYEIGIQGGQFSYATAIGLVNSVVNVILVFAVNLIAEKVSETSLW